MGTVAPGLSSRWSGLVGFAARRFFPPRSSDRRGRMTSTAALLSQLEVQRQEFALQRQVLEQRSKLHQEHVAEFRKIHARSVTRVRAKLLAQQRAARTRNYHLQQSLRKMRDTTASDAAAASSAKIDYEGATVRAVVLSSRARPRRALVSRRARVQVRFLDQAQGLMPTWREMTQEKQVAELQRLEVQKLQVQRETELARQVRRMEKRARSRVSRDGSHRARG